jgi:integrase
MTRLAYGAGVDIDTPKSRAGARTVNLPPPTLARLRRWKVAQARERKLADDAWRDEGRAFTTRTGEFVEPRWINKHFDELLARHGLPRITPHGLRHTFCTLLLQDGASIKDVQEIAGHARPSVTLNMYYGSLPGASGRISGQMGKLLGANYPEITQDGPEIEGSTGGQQGEI